MRYFTAAVAALMPVALATASFAQTAVPVRPRLEEPATTGAVIQAQPNTTGNDRDIIVAPGATGAETITTNSAARGNASHPERAVPNGSAGGGSASQGGG